MLAACALAACADADADRDRTTLRDSAGIEIVENFIADGGPPTWTVGEATLRIGRVEGEAEYLFDGIVGAVRVEDGRIVVANRGSNTVRWYAPDGTFLFERGGEGGGPGEFQRMASVGVGTADTLHVVDGGGPRVVRYTADGALVATTPLKGMTLPPGPLHALSDGSFVLGVSGFSTALLGDEIVSGVQRYPQPMLRYAPDLSRADTIGMFPGIEVEVIANDHGLRFGPPQFPKALEYVAAGDVIYIGTADRFEIGVYSPDGVLRRSIRVPDVDLRLTVDRIEAHKDRLRAQAPEYDMTEAEIERELAQLHFPETVPAYTDFLIDDEDNLWVARHVTDPELPRPWFVLDPDGRLIASIEVPPRFTLLEVAGGALMGRQRDELDVETLVIHPIIKEPQ